MLNSPSWSEDVELGALVAANPDLGPFAGRDDWPAQQVVTRLGSVAIGDRPPFTRPWVQGFDLVIPSDGRRIFDRSSYAVTLEELLDKALTSGPQLILEAIQHVATTR